jgi:hypothetical protein
VTGSSCGRERELLDAIAEDRVSEELRVHAATCLGCSETLLVASFLRRGAAESEAELPALPDPGYLWWRAHLERRVVASQRATRAITLIQRIALVSAGLLTVTLVRTVWPQLRSWLEVLNPAALAPALPADAARPGLVIAVSLLAVAALALLDTFGNWLEQ